MNDFFYYPYLKKRIDGTKPKYNPIYGEIGDCFADFCTDTFHFFGGDKEVLDRVWKTLLIKDKNYRLVIDDVIDFIGKDGLIAEIKRLSIHNLKLEYIIFHDCFNWPNNSSPIYLVRFFLKNEKLDYSIETYNFESFQKLLFAIQGSGMVMNKPLVYSQTELEGCLADACQRINNPIGKAIFPGDVDCLIVDDKQIKYLIEFKKHSLNSPLENESFRKYWYLDKKKYRAIKNLAKKFNLQYYFNIIYPTKVDINKIKLEKINSNGFLEYSDIISFESKSDLIFKLKKIFK